MRPAEAHRSGSNVTFGVYLVSGAVSARNSALAASLSAPQYRYLRICPPRRSFVLIWTETASSFCNAANKKIAAGGALSAASLSTLNCVGAVFRLGAGSCGGAGKGNKTDERGKNHTNTAKRRLMQQKVRLMNAALCATNRP